MIQNLGNHLIAELYDCDVNILNNRELLEKILLEAVKVSGATAIESRSHKFSPHGVSCFVMIAESHFSIHTWPEHNYCALDIFTCGNIIDNNKAVSYIKEKLNCKNLSLSEIKRGMFDFPHKLPHKPSE